MALCRLGAAGGCKTIVHEGRVAPGVALLNKPCRKADLARMVRQVLARRGSTWGMNGAPPTFSEQVPMTIGDRAFSMNCMINPRCGGFGARPRACVVVQFFAGTEPRAQYWTTQRL